MTRKEMVVLDTFLQKAMEEYFDAMNAPDTATSTEERKIAYHRVKTAR